VTQVRNGWFSFRWTQIFEAGAIVSAHTVVPPPPPPPSLPPPISFVRCISVTLLQLKARRASPDDPLSPFAPPPVEEVAAAIAKERPDGSSRSLNPAPASLPLFPVYFPLCPPAVVFAPHVETSAGIMLPDVYIKQLAAAAHAVGKRFLSMRHACWAAPGFELFAH
jgi:hypothetical protein